MRHLAALLALISFFASGAADELLFRINDATNGKVWKYIPRYTQPATISTPDIAIGESAFYERADIEAAIGVALEQAQWWNAADLYYDEDLLQKWGLTPTSKDEIVIFMNFTTGDDAVGFEKNACYPEFQWYLRKNENDAWEIVGSGYR
jgi:hypothetical protein